MITINEALSPRPQACAGRITNGMRRSVFALAIGVVIVALGAIPSPAQTTYTVDNIDLNPQPAASTTDGEGNFGQFWFSGNFSFSPGITLTAGDTIEGTVTFNTVAGLEVRNFGGRFYEIPPLTGLERFLISIDGPSNKFDTRFVDASIEFLDVTGALVENPITLTGAAFFSDGADIEFTQNMVNSFNSFDFTGFTFSYKLVSGLMLNLDNIQFRIAAQNIKPVCPLPAPVSTVNPVVIDFEGLWHSGFSLIEPSPYSEDGYTITNAGGVGSSVFGCQQFGGFTGSTALVSGANLVKWTLTNDNDVPFNLLRIDMAERSIFPAQGFGTLTYIGTKSDLTTVTHLIDLDEVFGAETVIFPSSFTNLISVMVDVSNTGAQYHQIDNIVLEPSSPVLEFPAEVAGPLEVIGTDSVVCGTLDYENNPDGCDGDVFGSSNDTFIDCKGSPNECNAFLETSPQKFKERPDGMEMVDISRNPFCTLIYFTFRGTVYEICKELLP